MRKFIILFIYILTLLGGAYGQTKNLHVLTKKVEKSFELQGKKKLVIKAEKGVVKLLPSTNKTIKVELRLVMKNPLQENAKKELEYARYNFYESNKELIFSNTLVIPASKNLESSFRAEYVIYVPQNLEISINNNFGLVKIENINAALFLELEYCDLELSNVSGSSEINVSIGDINLTKVSSTVMVQSKYSSLKIQEIKGNYEVKSEYGDVSVIFSNPPKSLTVIGNGTKISLVNKSCLETSISAKAENGKITIDENCYSQSKGKLIISQNKSSQYYNTEAIKLSKIILETSYADISLD